MQPRKGARKTPEEIRLLPMEHVTKRIDGASAVVDNLMVSAKAKETRGKLICTNDFAHVF